MIDCLQICMKNDLYVPHLSSKFQVFTFGRFKVEALLASCCRIRNFSQKKLGLATQSVAEILIKTCRAQPFVSFINGIVLGKSKQLLRMVKKLVMFSILVLW